MIKLIIGDGQTRDSQNDADIFAGIYGDDAVIIPYGDNMSVSIIDNNTVRMQSGVVMCEGRPIQIGVGDYEDFSIPTGTQGATVTYYLGFRIYTNSSGNHVEKYISTTNPARGSIRAGDPEMFAIVATVQLNGINLQDAKNVIGISKSLVKSDDSVITVPGSVILTASKTNLIKIFTESQIKNILGIDEPIDLNCIYVSVENGDYNSQSAQVIAVHQQNGSWYITLSAPANPANRFRFNYLVSYKRR